MEGASPRVAVPVACSPRSSRAVPWRARYREQFADPAAAPPALVQHVCDAVADRESRRCLWRQAHELDFGVVESRLAHITAPTLLVWGRDDPATDVRWARRLAADIPNARLEVIDGCGHYPPVEQPAAFAAATAAFVVDLP